MSRYVYRRLVERLVGRPLPESSVVHHVDGDRTNNEPGNLVVCPDQAYHMLLHARQRVIDAGGNPNTQKVCSACKEVLDKAAFSFSVSWDGRSHCCKECSASRRRGKYYYWNDRMRAQQRARRAACQIT